PTAWIVDPMFDARFAIQIARKAGKRNGARAEGAEGLSILTSMRLDAPPHSGKGAPLPAHSAGQCGLEQAAEAIFALGALVRGPVERVDFHDRAQQADPHEDRKEHVRAELRMLIANDLGEGTKNVEMDKVADDFARLRGRSRAEHDNEHFHAVLPVLAA